MRVVEKLGLYSSVFFLALGITGSCFASDETLQTRDHTVSAFPAQLNKSLGKYDSKALSTGTHKRDELPFNLLPDSALPGTTPDHDHRAAYIIHVAEWDSVNGAYALGRSTWYVYRAVCPTHQPESCEFVRTDLKADGKSPLIYGYRTIWLLGITHFATAVDPTNFTAAYKISTTPSVAQNIQDLGALLSAVIGATPASAAASALGAGAGGLTTKENNCPATELGMMQPRCPAPAIVPSSTTDTLISLARIQAIDKLPFVVNFNYVFLLNQTGGLPTAREGSPYSATVSVNGGNGNYSFRIVAGSLPTGLSIDPNSGSITGNVASGTSRAAAGNVCKQISGNRSSDVASCDWNFVVEVSDGSTPPNKELVSGDIIVESSTILNPAAAASLLSIAITPNSPAITDAATQQFTASGTYSDNSTQDITTSVVWQSSNTSAATISVNTGVAAGVGAGATQITAKQGVIMSPPDPLTVNAANLLSIEVTRTVPSIPRGASLQFSATGAFSDNSIRDITSKVMWTSTNPRIATIASNAGLAAAVNAGTTQVTATQGAIQSPPIPLVVTAANLVSIMVTPQNASIVDGANQQFVATGMFSDRSTQNVNVVWVSTNTRAAIISPDTGVATGIGTGTTQIVAMHANLASSPVTLMVTPATSQPAPFSLPRATPGRYYSSQVSVAATDGTYSYGVQGALPPGLGLNTTTGTISGVPASAGAYTFSIVVKNTAAGNSSPTQTFKGTLIVAGVTPPIEADVVFNLATNALVLGKDKLPHAALGYSYAALVSATPSGPYRYSVTLDTAKGQRFPAGLRMDNDGLIHTFNGAYPYPYSWDPKVKGVYSFTVNVTDTSTGAEKNFELALQIDLPTTDVQPSDRREGEVESLQPGTIGTLYAAGITAHGDTAQTHVVHGELPAGVFLSSSGILMGTPYISGNFEFTVEITGANKETFDKTFKLAIRKPILTAVFSAAAPANPSSANRGPADNTAPPGGGPGKNSQASPSGGGPPNSPASGNNSQSASQQPSQAVDCSAVTSTSPCSFTDSFQSDDRELWDVSVGLALPGPYERKYSASDPSSSSLTRHTDAYGLVDIYPAGLWFWGSRDSLTRSWVPHFNFGIPLTSQPFYRPYFGLSECVTTWTKLEAHGFPIRINVFAGFVDMKQQIAVTQTGGEVILKTDRALKPMFGIEIPVSSIVSKITGGKSQSSKGGGSANATGSSK